MKLSALTSLLSVTAVLGGVTVSNGNGTVSSSLTGVPVTSGDSPGATVTVVPSPTISSCLVLISATDSGSPTSVTFNSTPIATTTSSAGNVPESATTIVTTSNAQHSSQTVTLSGPQTLTTFMATVYPTSSGQYITVYPSGIIGNTTTIPICGGPPLDVGGTSTMTVPTSSSSSNSSQATGTNLQANDAGGDSTASSAGRLGFSPEGMALGAVVVLGMAAL